MGKIREVVPAIVMPVVTHATIPDMDEEYVSWWQAMYGYDGCAVPETKKEVEVVATNFKIKPVPIRGTKEEWEQCATCKKGWCIIHGLYEEGKCPATQPENVVLPMKRVPPFKPCKTCGCDCYWCNPEHISSDKHGVDWRCHQNFCALTIARERMKSGGEQDPSNPGASAERDTRTGTGPSGGNYV